MNNYKPVWRQPEKKLTASDLENLKETMRDFTKTMPYDKYIPTIGLWEVFDGNKTWYLSEAAHNQFTEQLKKLNQ